MVQSVPDPYRLLGVGRGATSEEIKAAHRVLAKRYHPDAPGGDTKRFLAIQEAYQTLSDPLRRRDWDARHAAGPVRAGDPAARTRARHSAAASGTGSEAPPSAARRRQAREAAGATGSSGPTGASRGAEDDATATGTRHAAWSASDRDPSARTYTWSASGVPWWEEGGPTTARRPPGRRRPANRTNAGTDAKRTPGGAEAEGARPAEASGRGPEAGREGRQPEDAAAAEAGAAQSRDAPYHPHEFEVYSRSSGAAWSHAARSYFRRRTADHWRPGSAPPSGPGTEVPSGPEGRSADGREPARSRPPGAPRPSGTKRSASPRAPTAAPTRPPRPVGTPRPAPSTAEPPRPSRRQPRAAGPGNARSTAAAASGLGTVLRRPGAGTGRRARQPWPSLRERLLYTLTASLPLVLGMAWLTGMASGCDRASASCPAYWEPLVAVLGVAVLATFWRFPRLAYLGAMGSLGLLAAAVGVGVVYGILGLASPLPQPLLLLAVAIWLAAYALFAWGASRDERVGGRWRNDPAGP